MRVSYLFSLEIAGQVKTLVNSTFYSVSSNARYLFTPLFSFSFSVWSNGVIYLH